MVGKYFLHGLLYSLLMMAFAVVWAFFFVFLVVAGSIIGLMIGLGLFFMGMGLVNKFIAGSIWGINGRDAWTSLLGHGFVLFLGLVLVQLPWMLVDVFFVDASAQIYYVYVAVQFLVMAIVDGVVGRTVASMFEETGTSTATWRPSQQSSPTAAGAPYFCPYCGVSFPYKDADISPDGIAVCHQCGGTLHDPRYKRGDSSGTRGTRPFP